MQRRTRLKLAAVLVSSALALGLAELLLRRWVPAAWVDPYGMALDRQASVANLPAEVQGTDDL
jgi:hypothetical protein